MLDVLFAASYFTVCTHICFLKYFLVVCQPWDGENVMGGRPHSLCQLHSLTQRAEGRKGALYTLKRGPLRVYKTLWEVGPATG